MLKTRRVHSKEFKAKVVLESLKEKSKIEVLAKKYELLPNQISTWKTEAMKNFSTLFSVTDITYIPMAKGFMYLAAIIDLKNRCVLKWDISNTMSVEWCSKLLQECIDEYGCPMIFNTDQDSQYTSNLHTKILLNNNIQISMNGKGRAMDNIFVERLWRSVKYENVYLQCYADGISLFKGLQKYFQFYNTERKHRPLN